MKYANLTPQARALERKYELSREGKNIIGVDNSLAEWSDASRQDGNNFITNRVTLQEYQDTGAANMAGVLALSTAWACVNLLVGTQASLPCMVYRTDRQGRRTVANDHPLYRVLHDSPNADQTAMDFWEFICACLELHGNGYCEIERANDGRVIALSPPLLPEMVMVRRGPNGDVLYEWSDGAGRRKANQADLLHIRGFGGSPLGGISTLSFGRQTFHLARSINFAAHSTFRNGVRPSIGLETDKNLNVGQVREARESLAENYAGTMNAGQPFLVHSGMKIKPISINPEDAQMLESRAFSVEEICRFFGVPPHMVGHTEKSTSWGTGLEEQTLGFQKFTLRRRLKRIEQALEKQLLTPKDRVDGVTIEFNLEGLLRGDSKARAEFYRAALGDTQKPGWMVRNEVRKLENLEPIDGWDDPIPLISQRETITVADPKPEVPPA